MNPNPQTNITYTQDEQVAQLILNEFIERKLIAPTQIQQVMDGLANGTLRAGDWRRIAENAIDLEAHHGKTAP